MRVIDDLVIRLLGRFEVCVHGEPVALGGPRQQSVLALLILARGKPVPSARLLDQVWDSEPPASALSTLHAYVVRLRKSLGLAGDCLMTTALGYSFEVPAEQVDVRSGALFTREMTPEGVVVRSGTGAAVRIGIPQGGTFTKGSELATVAGAGSDDHLAAEFLSLHRVLTEAVRIIADQPDVSYDIDLDFRG